MCVCHGTGVRVCVSVRVEVRVGVRHSLGWLLRTYQKGDEAHAHHDGDLSVGDVRRLGGWC